jgi:hypothetical protein
LKGTSDCDTTLKSLICEAGEQVLDDIAGVGRVKNWLNIELPRVRNPRVDLLARLESGGLLHVELQSTSDMTPQRMLEYGVGIWRLEGFFPRQLLLYVGNEPLRITNQFSTAHLDYRFEIIDIRNLDGDTMIESQSVPVNILSILAGSKDRTAAIRRIIMRIAGMEEAGREDALKKLLILAGMRKLAVVVEEESRKMPITFDIMDNDVLGPAIRKGIDQGLKEGRQEGEMHILAIQLEKRFGPLPNWATEKLANSSTEDVERLAVRLLESTSLEDLFR